MKSQVQAPGPRHATCIIDDEVFTLAHAYPVHMLIVLLSLLCTSSTPTAQLEYTKLQLECIDCYCYLHACEQLRMVIHPVCTSSHNHHQGISNHVRHVWSLLFDWVVLELHVCFSHLIIRTKQIYFILLLLLLFVSWFLLLHFLHKQVHPPHYKTQQVHVHISVN